MCIELLTGEDLRAMRLQEFGNVLLERNQTLWNSLRAVEADHAGLEYLRVVGTRPGPQHRVAGTL